MLPELTPVLTTRGAPTSVPTSEVESLREKQRAAHEQQLIRRQRVPARGLERSSCRRPAPGASVDAMSQVPNRMGHGTRMGVSHR